MSEPLLQPYLMFNGNCEEAMNFYKSIFGGELEINRFKEFAGSGMPVKAEMENKVMHCTLHNEGMTFMASDAMGDISAQMDSNISISIAGDDDTKLSAYFEGLSAGGEVTQPLQKQVWGDKFGMLVDKFGIHWMVNIGAAKDAPKS